MMDELKPMVPTDGNPFHESEGNSMEMM